MHLVTSPFNSSTMGRKCEIGPNAKALQFYLLDLPYVFNTFGVRSSWKAIQR
jgi:hypothetical protein